MKTLNTVRYTLTGAALAFALSASLIACNNKSANTNNLSKGSLQSDGATLFSSTTMSGQPLNISVRNFSITGANPYAQQQYGQPYYQQQYYQTSYYNQYQYGVGQQALTFELMVNNETRQLTSQLTSNAYGAYGQPAYAQQGYYGQQYGQYGAYGQTIQMAGYFQVTYQSMCYQPTCDEVMLSIIIQGYNGEARQIALRRNMRENRIVNMNEYTVSGNQYRSIDQLMREI